MTHLVLCCGWRSRTGSALKCWWTVLEIDCRNEGAGVPRSTASALAMPPRQPHLRPVKAHIQMCRLHVCTLVFSTPQLSLDMCFLQLGVRCFPNGQLPMCALARFRINLQQCSENKRCRCVLPPMTVVAFGTLNLVLDATAGGLHGARDACT